MGNNQNSSSSKSGDSTFSSRSSSKNSSKSAVNYQNDSKLPSGNTPLEKLAKILADKSREEGHQNGISVTVFTMYLFHRYPILASKIYKYFCNYSQQHDTNTLEERVFKEQCEKFLTVLGEDLIRETLVRMFAANNPESIITLESMRELLMCSFQICMDSYSDGPQTCPTVEKTVQAIVDGCFNTKNEISLHSVCHWLKINCPRLLWPVHRFAVHSLATSYRVLGKDGQTSLSGLQPTIPFFESQPQTATAYNKPRPHLLQMSMSWLLAGALAPIYSLPKNPNGKDGGDDGGPFTTVFLQKLLCTVPSHWVVLYDSNEMGLGCNPFLNHVLAYQGPTLVVISVAGGELFCVASPDEWRESHQYWGGEDAAVFQLMPKFSLLDKGPKLLYLNPSLRGYALGLRAGRDTRKPIITIDGGFEKVEFNKIPYVLERIEVWGCGDATSREKQLEIKKWQVQEAEKQRKVKLDADDWLDHPDRYLMELAGRSQYHQNQT